MVLDVRVNEAPPTPLAVQAILIAGKDLEIEWRTRATLSRVFPFAGILVLLFAVALDPDRGILPRVAPGLFWLAVLLCALLALGRSMDLERGNRAGIGLVMSGADPAAMFLGKAVAVAAELLILEGCLGAAMIAVYDVGVTGVLFAVSGMVLATLGIAAAGTLYGAMVTLDRSRDSLLAILLLPVLLPVLLAATKVLESSTSGRSTQDGLWLGLLAVFAALYGGLGMIAFPSLFEEA